MGDRAAKLKAAARIQHRPMTSVNEEAVGKLVDAKLSGEMEELRKDKARSRDVEFVLATIGALSAENTPSSNAGPQEDPPDTLAIQMAKFQRELEDAMFVIEHFVLEDRSQYLSLYPYQYKYEGKTISQLSCKYHRVKSTG